MQNKYNKIINILLKSILLSCILSIVNISFSEVFNVKVNVKVILTACEIYGNGGKNQPITVQLNNGNPMIIHNINGIEYETAIPYNLICDDMMDNPGLKFKFDGAASSFNTDLLKTSDDNLGLNLKFGGSLLKLGQWYNFNYNNQPALTVTPIVGASPGKIQEGEFTASGTLSVEYQ